MHKLNISFIGLCFTLWLALPFSKAGAAPILIAQPEVRVTAVTSEVTAPDGRRHDKTNTACVDAPPGRAFALSSAKITYSFVKNQSQASCYVAASNYLEFVPNFSEPSRLCVNAFVVSTGGFPWGKRGELTCGMSYSLYDNETRFNPPAIHRGSVQLPNPSVPMTTIFHRDAEKGLASVVEGAIPIRAVNDRLSATIEKALAKLDPSFTLKVPTAQLLHSGFDSRELNFFFDVSATAKQGPIELGFRCDISVRLLMPISRLKAVSFVDGGTRSSCETGGWLANVLQLHLLVQTELDKQLRKLIGETFDAETTALSELATEDPELATTAAPAWLYLRHCDWRNEPAICLGLTWTDQATFSRRIAKLYAVSPPASPAADPAEVGSRLSFFMKWANEEGFFPSATDPKRFPIGYVDSNDKSKGLEDGDMVLFSGLMCRAGMPEGCDLVKSSIDSQGRPWRSPRRIGEVDALYYATFSNDHLRGLLLYWATTGEVKSFQAFLHFVKTQSTSTPSTTTQLQSSYSMCKQREPNFTCMITANWRHIQALAAKHKLEAELPPDMYNLLADNASGEYGPELEAAFTISGYRLHLVAVDNLLEETLIGATQKSKKVTHLIAARQPMNPFFAFLEQGKTKAVMDLTDAQCPQDRTRTSRGDWSWQRADHRAAWKNGMIWDCYFAYLMLYR